MGEAMTDIVRISAPHFVGGLVVDDNRIVEAAPIGRPSTASTDGAIVGAIDTPTDNRA